MAVKLHLRTIRYFTFGLILLALGAGGGYYYAIKSQGQVTAKTLPKVVVNQSVPDDYQAVDFAMFWEVWRKLEREYFDPDKVDAEKMVYGAIKGMVASLGDPYTMFLPPTDQQRTEEELSGSFEGIGIQLGYVDSQLAVMAPLKGMPAEAAGVQAGDLILHIKDTTKDLDRDTIGMSLPEAVDLIRGEHGVPVTLSLYREGGNQPFEVTIARDTIVVPSVELELVESTKLSGKIAHLTLSRFGGRTDIEWTEIVDKIVADNQVKGIVLDMRNNPGGYLQGAIFVASEFIPSGEVVKQQGRLQSESYTVNRAGKLYNYPLVVLVNRGSASASEIVAGALRDRKQVKLVGTRTFGKGTVQQSEELSNKTGIHITTARWLLPSGSWIHDTGITPDIEATNSPDTVDIDEMLQTAVQVLEQ